MYKHLKVFIISLLAFTHTIFMFWMSGYDLFERGADAGLALFVSTGIFLIAYCATKGMEDYYNE